MTDRAGTVTALMAVHAGASPTHFAAALDSVLAQTRPPDAVVVVSDGPLTADHERVLAGHPGVTRVELPRQRGLGPALAAGLAVCETEWVARADADDLNEPARLEKQLDLLASSGADVCSSAMTEFEGDLERVVGVRSTPIEHETFARRLRLTNPVNHPSVVFRRELAVRAGGYQELPLLEDYDLWARMLVHGARFVGLTDPVVRFRTDGMQDRRTGSLVSRSERELQRRLVSYGLISRPRMVLNLLLRGAYRRLPRPLLERAYALLFRRRASRVPEGDQRW